MTDNVLQYFVSLDNGGAENRIMDVYHHIDSAVVTFDFAVMEDKEHFFDAQVKEKGSQKILFPHPRNGIIKNYKTLKQFFTEHKEDYLAVHTHVSWYSGVVLLAAKRAGIAKRIAHSRGWVRKQISWKDKLLTIIGKMLIANSATDRLAISEEAGKYLFGKNSIANGKCKVIPNSVDEDKYLVLTTNEKESIRRILGVTDDKTQMLVTVANLRAIKNHTFLLDIASELKKVNYNYKLFLIGEGDQRGFLEEKICENGLQNEVILLGNRDDVPQILGAFDGMIFPSLSEGFGGVVLESQLVGVPVVASNMVPAFTDMGIGMVKYISLNETPKEWAEQIIQFFSKDFKWSHVEIISAINDKGFSIKSTAREYLRTYGIDEETIEKAII